MRFNILVFSFLVFLFQGCIHSEVNNKAKKEVFINRHSFKIVKPILSETSITGYYARIFLIDTVLFCSTYRDSMNLFLFGLSSQKYLGSFIQRGNGSGECLGIADIIPTDNKDIFWVYDITLGKLLKYRLSDVLKRSNYSKAISEYILIDSARNARSLNWVNDTTFVGSSYVIKYHRGIKLSPSIGITDKFGELPLPQEKWPIDLPSGKLDLLATIYSSRVLYNKKLNKTVFAYMKMDRLDFFDQDTLSKIIRGPENFEPSPTFKVHKSYIDIIEGNKSLSAYSDLFADSTTIFTFFKGERGKNTTCGKEIFSYDWKGLPKEYFELPDGFCSFVINHKNNSHILFGYNFLLRKVFKIVI